MGHESTQGVTPRDFGVDPTETFLLAANQDTDTVVTFHIHPDTDALLPTGHIAEVMTPVCLTFMSYGKVDVPCDNQRSDESLPLSYTS